MNKEELIIKLRDPKYYLENFCKVKGKTPGLVPFILNEAQKDLFNTLKRSFRVIILKARQLGFCLEEHTRVLLSTLEWIELKDVKIGDRIISVEEKSSGPRKQKKMKTSIVEKKFSFKSTGIKITLDTGVSIIATKEHKLLSKKWECSTEHYWKKVKDFKIGDSIRYITKTWGDPSYEDGWFSGIIDGEGSMSKPSRSGVQLCVAQVDGDVFNRMLKYVKDNNLTYRIEKDDRASMDSSKLGNKIVYKIVINKMNELFELIGKTRPSRFISREWWNGKALPNDGWAKIVSIEEVGECNMIDLQTSEHTYIAEGIVSHNSTAVTGYFYHNTITVPGTTTALIGYNSDLTSELLDKIKTFHRTTPEEIRPTIHYNSKYEISFPNLESKIIVLPSTENVGRGYTLTNALCTELAFWDKAEEKITALEASVPTSGHLVIESTPNGMGNSYHRRWMSDNDYAKKEYGWWWGYSEQEIEEIRKRMNNPMKFAQEYGLEFLASGRSVFDQVMIKRLRKNQLSQGDMFKTLRGADSVVIKSDDLIEYSQPVPGGQYVFGVDVSEGVDGGDYASCTCFDRSTGEEVAFYRGYIAPDTYGKMLNRWGRKYNNALMVVEVNNHGLTTLTILKQLMYPCLYFRPSKFETMGMNYSDKMGWRTTTLTRPLLIDDFIQALRDGDLLIHSKYILDEMTTFIYDNSNNAIAQEGFHDDCIFGAALATQGFKVMYHGKLEQLDYKKILPGNFSY